MEQRTFSAAATALAIAASVCMAVIGVLLLPLWVEDAIILFHRANYTDLSIPFYYQGYISFLPQAVAALVTGLPPYLQAATYGAVACCVWSLMLVLFFRIAPMTIIPFAGVAYFFAFDLLYVFNLTYSLWPALVVIGLIGTLCQIERRPVRWWEAACVGLLSMSSPLSLLMALPFLPVVWAHRKSITSWSALGACVLAYPLLTEPGAGASGDLIRQIIDRLRDIAANPGVLFSISGERLPISPPRLLRVGSLLLCLGFVALSLLPTIRRRYGALLPFVLSGLAIVLIALSRGTGAEPIGTRYMFPVLFAGMLIASFLLHDLVKAQAPAPTRLGVYGIILAAGVGLAILEQPDPRQSLRQFADLRQASGSDTPVFFQRAGPFSENDWTLAIGPFAYTESDCLAESAGAAFTVQIYCGGAGRILYPAR